MSNKREPLKNLKYIILLEITGPVKTRKDIIE